MAITKLPTSRKKKVPVEFKCHAPWASSVFIAGTFNDWRADAAPLKSTGDGSFTTTLKLEPGRYEYKYIIDGRWCCEPGCCDTAVLQCTDCVPNPFGSMNRVVEVKASTKESKGSAKAPRCDVRYHEAGAW